MAAYDAIPFSTTPELDVMRTFLRECGERSAAKGFHGDTRSAEQFLQDIITATPLDEVVDIPAAARALEEWHKSRWNPSQKIALMHEELSEMLGEERNVDKDKLGNIYFLPSKPDKPEGRAVEAADLFIRLGDFVWKEGMTEDFLRAIVMKMAYNATRPNMHGRNF